MPAPVRTGAIHLLSPAIFLLICKASNGLNLWPSLRPTFFTILCKSLPLTLHNVIFFPSDILASFANTLLTLGTAFVATSPIPFSIFEKASLSLRLDPLIFLSTRLFSSSLNIPCISLLLFKFY